MDWLNFSLTLPVTDPTWIFLLVLLTILFAPILLNKLRIHIIGMILAGLVWKLASMASISWCATAVSSCSARSTLLYHVPGRVGNEYGRFQEESRKGCDAGIAGFSNSDRHRLGYQYDVAEVLVS